MSNDRDSGARTGRRFSAINISWPRILWLVAIAVLSGWLACTSPWFVEGQERHLFDILQKHYRQSDQEYSMIQVVAGDRSLQELKQWPLPRDVYARLVERLKPARLIIMDVPFDAASTPEEDSALIEAVQAAGNVVGRSRRILTPAGGFLQEPFPRLRDAFQAVGVANQEEDRDGIHRRGIWGLKAPGEEFVPSLALAALQELNERTFDFVERFGRTEVRLPWKNMQLSRSEKDFIGFWINHPRYEIPTCEYIDVLEGNLPSSLLAGTVVIVSSGRVTSPENVAIAGGRSISQSEYILHTLASLTGPFAPTRTSPALSAVLSAVMATLCASMGFVHFRKSFVFLFLCCAVWIGTAVGLFLSNGPWLPVAAPLWACLAGYLGSQIIQSWRLYHEWNVRSLSIRPLLALAQRADSDLDMGMSFDDYLRSLWSEIEDKTGVTLNSTRINENFSLVQEYLAKAEKTPQQSNENFLIIRNASNTSPRHRMLLPLPLWTDPNSRERIREYVILAWDGRIAVDTLTSLAALTLFAAVHFHALEEGRRRKDMLFKTMEAIMMAVETKDQTTGEHSRRVAALSKRLAQWMKLSPQEVDDIYFAAIIHDIGKLGVSDSVLKKPGVLTPSELAEMQKHPSLGEDIMRPVALPEYIISGILQHHERHDGQGYPYGLKGEHLTMAGKIIKVADVFDALMNRRQYKEAWTEAKVREFLLERRGTEFDPLVVDVFLKHLADVSNNPLLYYGITF